jgi:hypothetical protein
MNGLQGMDKMTSPKQYLSKSLSKGGFMSRYDKCWIIFWTVFSLMLFPGSQAVSQEGGVLTLGEAVMCEEIKGRKPVNKTILFSIAARRAICFTSFSKVPEKVIIFHNWYKYDKLIAKVRLRLTPPQWSSLSSIPLKEKDKGPWRVEVIDPKGKLLRVLRFSVTD